jgi:hypothetical protein
MLTPQSSTCPASHPVAASRRRAGGGQEPTSDPAVCEAGDCPPPRFSLLLGPPDVEVVRGRLRTPPAPCAWVGCWHVRTAACCLMLAHAVSPQAPPCGASPGPSRMHHPAGRVLGGRPVAPRRRRRSSRRSAAGGPGRSRRRSAARPARSRGADFGRNSREVRPGSGAMGWQGALRVSAAVMGGPEDDQPSRGRSR